jgi:hypothetical protein
MNLRCELLAYRTESLHGIEFQCFWAILVELLYKTSPANVMSPEYELAKKEK